MVFPLVIGLTCIYFKMGNSPSTLGISHLTEITLLLVRSKILSTSIGRASLNHPITVYCKSLFMVSDWVGGKAKL